MNSKYNSNSVTVKIQLRFRRSQSPMHILRAFAFLLSLAQALLAEQPTPILPYPKLTPGDTFNVTAQDVCVPRYARKVRAVPAWLKRQAYAEYKSRSTRPQGLNL